jgi:putative NADPH-quinone reductase
MPHPLPLLKERVMRIVIVQGHPDPGRRRFLHALEAAYAEGAASRGHELRTVVVAELDFPLIRTKEEYDSGTPPPDILRAQTAITWGEHLVFFFPLWLGTMPALVKGFLKQTFRPGFAMDTSGPKWKRLLSGRSARLVVTMGMPEPVYRWYFLGHGVKGLERNVLKFTGISPVRETWIGSVEQLDAAGRSRWLARLRRLGVDGR